MADIEWVTKSGYQVIEDWETRRIWVNGLDGGLVGRYGPMGIDIHNSTEAQMSGAPECLHCTHEPSTLLDWIVFCQHAKRLWGVDLPIKRMQFANAFGAKQELVEYLQSIESGMYFFHDHPTHGPVAMMEFLFTWGIVADLDFNGYGRRWCYPSMQDAAIDLTRWMKNQENEPSGFSRRLHSVEGDI